MGLVGRVTVVIYSARLFVLSGPVIAFPAGVPLSPLGMATLESATQVR